MTCSIHSLIFEVNEVYAFFRQKGDFTLSEVDILNIQNALLSGNFHFSPLRIVVETNSYSGSSRLLYLSPSPADDVVIGALGGILVKELRQSSYFRQSCFSTYSKKKKARHYLETIQKWSEIEALLLINCSNSLTKFPRSLLIEKVKPIVNYDDGLVKLISSFCNLPLLDNTGKDWSVKTGVPPLLKISEILYNIFLDEIDREIEERLPKLKYARYEYEIFVPIFNKEKVHSTIEALSDIFKQYNFLPPTLDRAVRGDKAIPFSAGFIHIDNEGKSQIKYV